MAEIFDQLGSGLGDRQVAPTTAADRPVEPARGLRPAVLDKCAGPSEGGFFNRFPMPAGTGQNRVLTAGYPAIATSMLVSPFT
jgi:hypothetical protein